MLSSSGLFLKLFKGVLRRRCLFYRREGRKAGNGKQSPETGANLFLLQSQLLRYVQHSSDGPDRFPPDLFVNDNFRHFELQAII